MEWPSKPASREVMRLMWLLYTKEDDKALKATRVNETMVMERKKQREAVTGHIEGVVEQVYAQAFGMRPE
jgi:hypothetical protein